MREIWFVCPGCGEKVRLNCNYPLLREYIGNPPYVACCECEKCGWRSPYGKGRNEDEAMVKALSFLDKLSKRWKEDVRLIEANKLKNVLLQYCENSEISELKKDGIMRAIEIIELQPTFDAKPVIHANWLDATRPDEDDYVESTCSNCLHTDRHHKELSVPYCWCCGAKMDEATEDNPTD